LPNVTAVNAAVSAAEGKAQFFHTQLDDASSLLKPVSTGSVYDKYMTSTETVTVNVVQLDKYLDQCGIGSIDILKMDAQGSELDILKGASGLLSRHGVNVIYTEVQFMRLYEKAALYHEIATFLAEFGYELHNLYGFVHNQKGELGWGDAIFVQKRNADVPV